jgi:beta-glucosidase
MAQGNEFPSDFLWACATASYQVEGAAAEDGRGPSVWDTFSHSEGKVRQGHHGDVACDQYHRYPQDVQVMKWLGIKAYRFSVSWSRIFPDGDGEPNEAGIAYYDRLTDELLAHGIQPWVTYYHWDTPQSLEDRFGGWRSRETSTRFADYVAFVAKRLSDRVIHHFTINEFACYTDLGYAQGIFPPGLQLPAADLNQIRHHALLGHGLATQAIRANARQSPLVGIAENTDVCVPAIESESHIDAARTAMRVKAAPFITAVQEGRYPDFYLEAEGDAAPSFTDEEMAAIGTPLDFLGMNMYTPTYVVADDSQPHGYREIPHSPSYPKMFTDWLYFCPQITYWGPRFARELWDVPEIYITENGCPCDDQVNEAGKVEDTDRVMYIRNHLISLQRAVAEGIPVKGYFLWSLMDNFEWIRGYTERFGIIHVDFDTLERTPKLSADFYRATIRSGHVM